jgi:formate-dependent nitrite reductase membrane component NrfD
VPVLVPPPLRPLIGALARPAGLAAAAVAPAIATYTAVLLADTSVPTWSESYPELPFVFSGSAAAAASGVALLAAPVAQTVPARRLAVLGAALELAAAHRMESRLGLVGEPLHTGRAGKLLKASRIATAGGALLGATLGRRSRTAAAVAGIGLVAGSVLTRFGIFEAGVVSTEDPKYVVIPQRERLNRRRDSSSG